MEDINTHESLMFLALGQSYSVVLLLQWIFETLHFPALRYWTGQVYLNHGSLNLRFPNSFPHKLIQNYAGF